MKTPDYYERENEFVRRYFDVNQVISFQKNHRVEVKMESDWQYACYIDGGSWGSSLTPLMSIIVGIRQYMAWDGEPRHPAQNPLTPDQAFNPEDNNSKDPITII